MKAELKPEELRINNWITDCLGNAAQVTSIHESGSIRVNGEFAMHIDTAKPIELSEEWLKKAGCTEISKLADVWRTPNGITFNFFPENHCGLITFGSRHVNFWYVHTFQNIIALTGNELIFNHG